MLANRAEAAETLSTALAVSPPDPAGDIAAGLDGVALLATAPHGRTRRLGRRRVALARRSVRPMRI